MSTSGSGKDDEDDDDDEALSRRCVDCSKWSPKTKTAHTLISAQHGWRLLKGADATGQVVYEWRCPQCWATRKSKSA